MQAVGYLRYAELGGAQQESGLHEQVLVDIVDDRTPRNLTDYTRKIHRGDVQCRGIETYVVMLGKVFGQQPDETDKDFFHALRHGALSDGALLRVLQVQQENSIEHLHYLLLIYMVGMQIGRNLTHLGRQLFGIAGRKRQFGLVHSHYGQIGYTHKVAHRGQFDTHVLISQEADAGIIWGGGHGVALCIHKAFKKPLDKVKNSGVVKFFSWLLTFLVCNFLFVFFRAESFAEAKAVLGCIFTNFDLAYLPPFVSARVLLCIMIVIVFALHFVPQRFYDKLRGYFVAAPWIVKLLVMAAVIALVLHFASADVKPFIYAQY